MVTLDWLLSKYFQISEIRYTQRRKLFVMHGQRCVPIIKIKAACNRSWYRKTWRPTHPHTATAQRRKQND